MQFLKRVLSRDPNAGSRTSELPQRRLRVLLVDENKTARTVIARRLSHRNYDVALADSGFAALSMLVTRPVDIVLIDMDIAILSAIATMQKIRAANVVGTACFVTIAGQHDSQSTVDALDAGADDHIVKPFDFDVLDARLRHLCQRAEQIGALSRYNAELDARIARRAVELGETREELREMQADRARLVSSIQALHDKIERLQSAKA
ncbi:response regulator [Sphingobium sp. CCH11-B1]|jgi:DNA-binding response OmpR family regulator|uniref:response regulator n=1 Tax=Sphingobium sp. CCH11-B1 TaxID=1768781 RepID=UPI00082FFE38|nr:response regulator [Sphingobium sp. CCH11-B1]